MAGYDPSIAPTFEWPEHLKKAKALIKAHAQRREARAVAAPSTGKQE
jgi:hypothetical protein